MVHSSQEVKRLVRNQNTLELYPENQIVIETQDDAVCDVCGEEFEHPLMAELISGDDAEEYYACPRCLSKVGEVEHQEKIEIEEIGELNIVEETTELNEIEHQEKIEIEEIGELNIVEETTELNEIDSGIGEKGAEGVLEMLQENEPAKLEDTAACPHYLGYLKKRPKNSPIPENCFTCMKMIDCTR